MKQAVLEKYGPPEEGVRCVEAPDVGAPGAGEVVFDVLAFPINPADVSMCRGSYRLRPTSAGHAGRRVHRASVTAVGAGVSHVKPGDLVITLQRENWAQKRRVKGDDTIARAAGHRPSPGRHAPHQPGHGAPAALRRRRSQAGRLGHPERRQLGGGPPAHPAGPGARHQDRQRSAARVAVRRAEGARRRRLRRRRPRSRRRR